ncbi:hypothetical protein DMUE_4564 [Dictyocoela muelleri]|nr:hypothetical protein DMUE_4564 [Dictyocoela muelleri]
MDIETKLEIAKYLISDLNSLLNKISAIENIIIENLSLSCTLERHKIPDHEYSIKNTKDTHKRNKHHEKQLQKFFSYHKTSTHNKEKCRALKRENKINNSKEKTFVVKESVPKIRNYEVDMNIEGQTYNALIGTG